MQINFYQTEDLIHKAIAPILTKILEEKKRALIFCQNQDLINQIDDGLWSFSKTKFIPHGTENDDIKAQDQPIFLSSKQQNQNQSSYLIMLDKIDDDFGKNFEKIFYFFNNDSLAKSKEMWRYYKSKNFTLNFYKKENDKWVMHQNN